MVDGKELGGVILELLGRRFGTAGEVVAVDGKAICSTAKAGQAHSALQILSAYITGSGVTLAQEEIHKKTNEIPVFQEMLTYLNVKGKVVTADAMHCQRETCRRIVGGQGDYVFGLKENQPSLLEARPCLNNGNMPKGERFFRQTRRFSAAILCVLQGKATPYGGKRSSLWACCPFFKQGLIPD